MANTRFERLARAEAAIKEINDWSTGAVYDEDDPRPMAGNDFDQAALSLADAVGKLLAPDFLKNLISELSTAPCAFWACDGPDARFVAMKTCRRCAAIQDLREALS